MKRSIPVLVALALAGGCATEGGTGIAGWQNWQSGALIGAGVGAAVGAMAYSKNRTQGALIGAVGGGLAGGAVGAYMDNQRKDLEKSLAKEIQAGQARIDTMPNHVVRVTMTNQTAFETNSSEIKPGFETTMGKIADVVVRYGKTSLTVVGHTDNVGANDYNQKLSERRAHAVAQYLAGRRVDPIRLAVSGRGETQPIAGNNSESGRQANRRVEIYVEPVVQG
jgi:outer membrane protein OmpA-like peptidoglycan-associated protein